MTDTSLWLIVAAVLTVVALATVAHLAHTWRRRVGGKVFDLEVAM